jgi:hypothetical protein
MLAWGMNDESTGTSHSLLLETSASGDGLNTWFGRFEVTGKPAHSLHVSESAGVFTVGKLQAGYVRYFSVRRGLQPGFGGHVLVSLIPGPLQPRYGGSVVPGLGVFLTVRPGAH